MKKLVRLTESDLHKIVKESVSKLINEIGDTPKGQRALGALGMRHALRNPKYDARDTKSKEAKIHKYAEKARGGDTYNYKGTPQNPMWYDFADGAVDYINAHPDELAAAHRKAGMAESKMLREWEDGAEGSQMRFDSILNTCEEETERLIDAIYKSDGIFSAGNDEVMEMRLRRLLKLLKTHATQKFERVKNSIGLDSLLNILGHYYSTARKANYDMESLDYQGVNSYVNQLEHLLVGVL